MPFKKHIHALIYTTPSPKCSAYKNFYKSNDIQFDQVCRTNYQHLEYQLNTIRFLTMYIFIWYRFGSKKTWSKLILFDFLENLYALHCVKEGILDNICAHIKIQNLAQINGMNTHLLLED
jgi:hypothetical protein